MLNILKFFNMLRIIMARNSWYRKQYKFIKIYIIKGIYTGWRKPALSINEAMTKGALEFIYYSISSSRVGNRVCWEAPSTFRKREYINFLSVSLFIFPEIQISIGVSKCKKRKAFLSLLFSFCPKTEETAKDSQLQIWENMRQDGWAARQQGRIWISDLLPVGADRCTKTGAALRPTCT